MADFKRKMLYAFGLGALATAVACAVAGCAQGTEKTYTAVGRTFAMERFEYEGKTYLVFRVPRTASLFVVEHKPRAEE